MKADAKTQPMVVAVGQKPAQPFRQLLEQPPKDAATHPQQRARTAGSPVPQVERPAAARPVVSGAVTAGSTPLARITLTSATAADVARTARGRVEAEAHRLHDVRGEMQVSARESAENRQSDLSALRLRRKERVVELITRELVAAFDDGGAAAANDLPQKPSSAHPGAQAPQGYPADASSAKPQPPSGELEKASGDRAAQAVALIEKIEVFVKSTQRPALELTLNNSLGARVEIERLGPGEVALKLVGKRGPPPPEAVNRIRDELAARGLKVAAMSVA
jgi:hypothetical protein